MTLYRSPDDNFISTTLNGSINDSATTITLNDASKLNAPGYIVIDREDSSGTATADKREIVSYTGISSNQLTGCTRGADNSTNRSHNDGALVEPTFTVGMWENLQTNIMTSNATVATILTTPKVMATNATVTTLLQGPGAVFTSLASVAQANIATLNATNTYGTGAVMTSVASINTARVNTLALASAASIAQLSYGSLKGDHSGWIADDDTWTYASASTFTIAGKDVTAKFPKGTRLKFTQTTAKYAVVVASSFSTNTTITILANTDYTIANAAITLPNYSYQMSPQGYPGYFTLAAPTWDVTEIDDGSGGQPTTNYHRVRVDGNMLTAHIDGSGTKAGTNWYFSYLGTCYPAIANTTVGGVVGACNAGWSGNDHEGAVRKTADDYYLTFDSDRTIADNQALSIFSATISVEI